MIKRGDVLEHVGINESKDSKAGVKSTLELNT